MRFMVTHDGWVYSCSTAHGTARRAAIARSFPSIRCLIIYNRGGGVNNLGMGFIFQSQRRETMCIFIIFKRK